MARAACRVIALSGRLTPLFTVGIVAGRTGQGALAFEIWTGLKPDPDRMESIIRRYSGA